MPDALVIPGLVAVDPGLAAGSGPAEVVVGPLAGKAVRADLGSWKQEKWFLPRAVAAKHGVKAPEERLDLATRPRLAALLRGAALVGVADHVAAKALGAGDAALFVAYHRGAGGGGLEVHEGGRSRGFSADDVGLARQAFPVPDAESADEDREEEAVFGADIPLLYDRVLRTLSGGAWSLLDVDLAETAARLTPHELTSREDALARLAAATDERRPVGEALVASLASATVDTLAAPGGFTLSRTRAPAFTLRAEAGVTVRGGPLEIPPDERWVAADVAASVSPAPDHPRDHASHAAANPKVSRMILPWIAALAALAALAWWLVGRR